MNLSVLIKTFWHELNWLKRLRLRVYYLENIIGNDTIPYPTKPNVINQNYDDDTDEIDKIVDANWYIMLPDNANEFFANTKNNYILTNYFERVRCDCTSSMQSIFKGCKYLDDPLNPRELNLSQWNTWKVNNMASMFQNCRYMESLKLSSNFKTTDITSTSHMFDSCLSLKSLDLSSFNTSKVTDMSYMFYNCQAMSELSLTKFDVSKVGTMTHTFDNCTEMRHLNLTNWNISTQCTDMSYMFASCKELKELKGISGWNVSKVETMENTFYNCEKLEALILSGWNISSLNNAKKMFNSCNNMQSLTVSDNFVFKNGITSTAIANMFDNTPTSSTKTPNSDAIPINEISIDENNENSANDVNVDNSANDANSTEPNDKNEPNENDIIAYGVARDGEKSIKIYDIPDASIAIINNAIQSESSSEIHQFTQGSNYWVKLADNARENT